MRQEQDDQGDEEGRGVLTGKWESVPTRGSGECHEIRRCQKTNPMHSSGLKKPLMATITLDFLSNWQIGQYLNVTVASPNSHSYTFFEN